jgi:hypothetical protein
VDATQISVASETASQRESNSKRHQYVLYGILLLVIAFFALVRVHLRNMPLERDEGEYAYAGQLIRQAIPPYQLAYNMKLPGTYGAYAVIMSVFGESAAGIRLGLLLVNAATSLLVFLLARRVHSGLAGVVAGCTFALLSTRSSVLGFQGHATHFVALFAVAGILLLLSAIDSDRSILFFLSGLSLGMGILMKQHGAFLCLFAALYALWTQRLLGLRKLALRGALFSAGAMLPFSLTCLLMLHYGVFSQFWFWTFSYGRAYASEMSLRQGWEMIRAVGPWMVRPLLIWGIAAFGLTAVMWSQKVRTAAPFSLGLLFFSLLSVIPGFYFRPHYFILLLPAVSLWAGIAVAAAQEYFSSRRWWAPLPLLVFATAFAFSVRGQWKFFFPSDIQSAWPDSRGCGDGCPQEIEVADYLRANSSPTDEIAVLGSEPAIYFYSHRHSATGYIYMYALTERQKYAVEMRTAMIGEVERARPAFIVYVDDANSWWNLGSTKELSYLAPLQQWIFSQYQLEKQVVIPGEAGHQWGDRAAFHIFRRRN